MCTCELCPARKSGHILRIISCKFSENNAGIMGCYKHNKRTTIGTKMVEPNERCHIIIKLMIMKGVASYYSFCMKKLKCF